MTDKPGSAEAQVITLWEAGEHGRSPYLTRVIWGALRLHIFHRGDADPDCHDHPADFWTFPLVSYREAYIDGRGELQERIVRAFRLHRRRAEFAHRVIGPTAGNGQIATIVLWGKKRREWGFHTAGGWVPWRRYVEQVRS